MQSQRRLSDVVKRSLIPVQGSFGVCGSGFGVWSLLRAYSVVGFGFRVSGFGFRVFGAARRQSRVSAEAHCVCQQKKSGEETDILNNQHCETCYFSPLLHTIFCIISDLKVTIASQISVTSPSFASNFGSICTWNWCRLLVRATGQQQLKGVEHRYVKK